jgi:hypothetical protein
VELVTPDGGSAAMELEVADDRAAWRVAGAAAGMRLDATLQPDPGAPFAQLRLALSHEAATSVQMGIRICLDLPLEAAEPWWLIPGLLYGANRPIACRRRFPRYERGAHDAAGMVSEHWSFRVDRAATPAVFGWAGDLMAALATSETTEIGPAGIGLEGSATRTRIWVDLPYREEPVAYRGYDRPDAADIRTRRWQPGERAAASVVISLGDANRHGYVPFLRHLHARWTPATPPAPWVSVEVAAGLAADGLLAWHYHPEHRALYETAAFERELDGSVAGEGDRPHMHVGWVSGVPWAAQLLAWGRRIGSEPHRAAGEAVIDNIAEHLSGSGTFWAEWTLEHGWGTGWNPRGTIHANTIGQATLFLLRAVAAEDRHAARHPAWDAAIRSNLDAIAGRQRTDGNLGTYHDAQSGAVTEWDGAGALPWIPALLDGATRYDEPRYRDVALRAGRYYRRFVDDELLYGAPEDLHLAPSSEDGYNALIAFMALHRATEDAAWLDVARRAADWALTFRYAYDVDFPPDTMLGTYGFRTRGTDQASPANQHLHHFGLLCLPELVELSRASGDDHYRLRADESLVAWRQFVARRDGDFNARRGMISERFYQTDCFRPKGSLLPLSHAWTGGVLLFACLAALEDPDGLSA